MTCPRCGNPGLHSCIGYRPRPPSPEDEAALQNAIKRIKTLRKESTMQDNQTQAVEDTENAKWDNRELGASEAHVDVVNRASPEGQAIAAAGLTHVVLDPAPAVAQPAEEEDDFLAGKKACSIDNPECESCQ